MYNIFRAGEINKLRICEKYIIRTSEEYRDISGGKNGVYQHK